MQLFHINKYFLILLGFFIPISTFMTSFFLVAISLFWLFDNVKDKFQKNFLVLKSNPVSFISMIVFLIFLIGVLYADAEKKEILAGLSDGSKFLFISLTMIYFADGKFKSFFLSGFISAMIITLLLSYLLWFGLLPDMFFVKGSNNDCVIFHSHITQNTFMAYTAFIFAIWSRFALSRKLQLVWGLLSLAAFCNVFLLVAGRTGHLVMIVLFIYFFLTWKNFKSFIIALMLILFFTTILKFYPTNPFFLRTKAMIKEIKEWNYKKPNKTSSGQRLEFYFNSLKIINENLFFGTGTASFQKTYKKAMKETAFNKTANPHNDYLMIAVQFGIIGFLALLIFFVTQWRCAVFLTQKSFTLLSRGFIITIMLSCMVNSPISDHGEGWFFAFMSAFFFAGIDKSFFKKGLSFFRA